jgi:PBP1b-binding outer membrane lipoprotein LpoB
MSRSNSLGIAVLLACLLLTGCAGELAGIESLPGAAREPIELVILHTNDNWGESEPCG